jgi:hypothetical protein
MISTDRVIKFGLLLQVINTNLIEKILTNHNHLI